jgi:adenylosuccinate synthase
MVNGIDEVAVTNLDGLDTLAKIKVCVAYKVGRKKLEVPPSDSALLAQCEPVYEEHSGWQTPTDQCKAWDELPKKAQAYLKHIAKLSGAKLTIASVGPNREQTILL